MADRKTIAVVGATGGQGGGLARAILADEGGDFSVRAITRNTDSDNAKALASAGAEVVRADLDDADSVKAAFAGAFGAYCVTNFWEHFSPEKELDQAVTMARAAKDAGVRHAIWSTFEDVREYVPLADDGMPTLMGKHKVPHFEGKAEANKVFSELGVPTTFLLTSFYWENFIHFGMGPQLGPDGKWAITLPMADKKLPQIGVEDIGKCAYGIFKSGKHIGGTVGVAGEHLTGYQMAASLGKALGIDVDYNDVPADVYRGFDFPGAADLGNMFQFKRDFEDVYCGHRNLDESRSLNPELQTLDQWLTKNKSRIPLGS